MELQLLVASTAMSVFSSAVMAQTVLPMSNFQWTLSNPALNISVPGQVPSQVHLDLHEAQVISDPYYGLNDFDLRWVADANWTYEASLAGLAISANSSTWLVFNGLDTFASVRLCDQLIASTNNQFRQYYFDVSGTLSSCKSPPILSIEFGSAPNIANQIASTPGAEQWPTGVEQVYEYPNRQYIRKEQSDFGWDWGPAFAPAGVWQPAYVVQLGASDVYIRNSLLDIYREGQLNNLPPDQSQPWVVNASLDLIGLVPDGASVQIEITDLSNVTIAKSTASDLAMLSKSTVGGHIVVPSNVTDLWWPNGLGPQPLYNFKVSLLGPDSSTIATTTKRAAFRTIVLNMEPISQTQLEQGIANGNNWHFEINGHEFYAKGSNLIPPDAFWPRVTQDRMQQLFQSVVDGGQNMLRVWASGAYQPEFIYDIADEMGILLWSEFEFSDALYPVDPDFLSNVREEANYNVRRVNHHPSLALWAGGNELENLELYLANLTDPNNPRWMAEYETLFLDVLLPAVYENSRSISYIPSSTTNGYLTLNHSAAHPMIERYNNLTAGYIYGDTDHYDYDSSVAFNLSSYPVGRFANEFGFHSMPSLQTWRTALDPEDLHFNSTTILLRNHHYPAGSLNTSNFANSAKGMGEMTLAVQRYYPAPNKSESLANFTSWCLATQIFQADYYRSQITYYRRGSGFPNRQLGSLYWQLEDIWQAPSWAGIEYGGRWKVLHYIAKDVYKNVIVAPYWNYTTGDLSVWVTSDLWSSVNGTVDFRWYDWAGREILNVSTSRSAEFGVGALNATKVLQSNTQDLADGGLDLSNAVLRTNITASGKLPNNDSTTAFEHEAFFHPLLALQKVPLMDPGLKLSVVSNSTDGVVFGIEATTAVSAWTWLDFPSGVVGNFEDNGFWLVPGERREVTFTVTTDETGGQWSRDVNASSLWDFTQP